MKKLFIIAGEPSGDLHASNLVREIRKLNSEIKIKGWGGDLMENQGVEIKNHIRNLSFMGFLEVFMNLRKILSNFRLCKSQILEFNPDIVLMIDYPGFNLRMAKWAKRNGILVSYYISPQIWAWKASRIKTIKATIDRMYCILPFEKGYYARFGVQAHYMGHPLMDEIQSFENNNAPTKFREEKPIIAILPGSREQEVNRKLSIMLKAAVRFKEYDIIVACAPNMDIHFFKNYKKEFSQVRFVFGQTYELLKESDFAIVTSGTATLETALFRVPQVVCYKSSFVSYMIARIVIKIKFISLVNLIMNEKIVTELIQKSVTEAKIKSELELMINNKEYRDEILNGYDRLIEQIGKGGCSEKIAQDLILNYF